jgi:hypothetical protein
MRKVISPLHIPLLLALITGLILGAASPCRADGAARLSQGQLLYVPVYSHIYAGDKTKGNEFYLAATLSLRNIDQKKSITVTQADYYDSQGKLIRKYLDKTATIAPFSAMEFIVKESDIEGGSGAKFVIRWQSDEMMSPPLVEAVMIGAKMQQGISFTSRAIVLEESDGR